MGIGELTTRIRMALRHRLRREGSKASIATDGLLIDVVKRLVTRILRTVPNRPAAPGTVGST